MTERILLAGDLGGTNTRLAIVRTGADGLTTLHEQHFETDAFTQLLPMLQAFLADAPAPAPTHGCIAIAGPVEPMAPGQRARVTRQQWDIVSSELRQALGFEQLQLVNDFEAIGHAIAIIPADQLHTLQAGTPMAGSNRAVIGAGTGLGQALLVPAGDDYRVIPTEGGHADFAPQGKQQIALLRYLEQHYPHVSYDRVISGPGLVMIYDFVATQCDATPQVDTRSAGAAATISTQALAGHDPVAVQAMTLFLSLYGAQAGNLALAAMARGGLYIAGGIAPKLLPLLETGSFMAAFHAKGRMTELMHSIPVHVVLTPQVGLLGAAHIASRP